MDQACDLLHQRFDIKGVFIKQGELFGGDPIKPEGFEGRMIAQRRSKLFDDAVRYLDPVKILDLPVVVDIENSQQILFNTFEFLF